MSTGNALHNLLIAAANADSYSLYLFFFFNDTATTEIYTLSLHDALPISKNSKYDSSLKKRLNISTNKPISAIVPMHTFGFPCRIDEIVEIGNKYNIPVIEDSAESLGSYYKNKHTGTFGLAGIFSYNGNKTITTGGGGMIITDNEEFAKKAKHITTTAKVPHRWEYVHDEVAYNYRMTNVTAAIGVAQMEKINKYLANKRETAEKYKELFESTEIKFFNKLPNTKANFWLNTILLNNLEGRNNFMQSTNDNGVMTRPIWRLMNKLEMYKNCKTGNLDNSEWFEERVINIPSGYRL